MGHNEQLEVCAFQNKMMSDKLNEISQDVKDVAKMVSELREERNEQKKINESHIAFIEEQKKINDSVRFVAWIGKNYIGITGIIFASIMLYFAYLQIFIIKK